MKHLCIASGILASALVSSCTAQDITIAKPAAATQTLHACVDSGIAPDPAIPSVQPQTVKKCADLGDDAQGLMILLLHKQIELLGNVQASNTNMSTKLDQTTAAIKDANTTFNQRTLDLINKRFDALPKDIQATDVYKTLRKDLLAEVCAMLPNDKPTSCAATESQSATSQTPSPNGPKPAPVPPKK